jgi:hypothetical protein
MALNIEGRQISCVRLIDDDPAVRGGYRYSVEDLELDPLEVFGPITDFDSLVSGFRQSSDAVICDYNLKIKNYSSVNGDEVVAGLYKRAFPVVLCTRFEGQLPLALRKLRRFIPVVLPPAEMNPDRLRSSFELCVSEFAGRFVDVRSPHRAQVRVEGGELLMGRNVMGRNVLQANLVIPSWSMDHLISIELDESEGAVYQFVADAIRHGSIDRMFAQVNLGAQSPDELYLTDWELV